MSSFVLKLRRGVYSKPLPFEERLQKSFPGSEWITHIGSNEQQSPDSSHPGSLVVHCKREPYDVYIGRPSKWGNPFSHKDSKHAKFQVASVGEAIAAYESWLLENPELLDQLEELKGKILGCWCAPGPCHGDVLARLANPLRPLSASTRPLSIAPGAECDPLPPGGTGAVAVIGAQKFDPEELERWMRSLPKDTLLVTGDGRGAEQRVRELGSELGIRVDVPELRPDWFGPKARDGQVGQILAATSGDVVLVGKGARTAKVESWYKRARWGRELVRLT